MKPLFLANIITGIPSNNDSIQTLVTPLDINILVCDIASLKSDSTNFKSANYFLSIYLFNTLIPLHGCGFMIISFLHIFFWFGGGRSFGFGGLVIERGHCQCSRREPR